MVSVVLLLVPYDGEDKDLSMMESQSCTTPLSVVNDAPLIEYSHPLTDIAVCVVMPDTTIVFEVYWVESSAFVREEKLNIFGTVSAGMAKAKSES